MLKLNEGNVLLKPSHRKQLMSWLKRVLRLGERIGDFVLTISLQRTGRQYEVVANVHDKAGDFNVRSRQQDWRNALRSMVQGLAKRLHDQRLQQAVAL